jgi:hypothetical protein
MRRGGGAHGADTGASHEEARTRQHALDGMLLRSQSMSGSNARSQRSHQLRQSVGTEDTRGDHKSDGGVIVRHLRQEKQDLTSAFKNGSLEDGGVTGMKNGGAAEMEDGGAA